jgi:hypothetical protein
MWTELAEGNIRADRKQGFNEKATAELEKNVALLDPNGLFSNK